MKLANLENATGTRRQTLTTISLSGLSGFRNDEREPDQARGGSCVGRKLALNCAGVQTVPALAGPTPRNSHGAMGPASGSGCKIFGRPARPKGRRSGGWRRRRSLTSGS